MLTILIAFMGIVNATAQEVDSLQIQQTDSLIALTTLQRDSVLISLSEDVHALRDGVVGLRDEVGRYKVYRTENIYNNLKLDTATGRVTALQIGIDNDNSRFEYSVCDAVEDDGYWQIIGRFELYPTGNRYNFVLLDTIFGRAWQVQWSTDNNCGRWRIW